jgi:hypothetical protein
MIYFAGKYGLMYLIIGKEWLISFHFLIANALSIEKGGFNLFVPLASVHQNKIQELVLIYSIIFLLRARIFNALYDTMFYTKE